MVILIAGASHTGKTLLAQKILERNKFPYLSSDHLKMGLIRSGYTSLTPYDDTEMTDYLWPVIREIIKTAIENGQNLVIEGIYIPFLWEKDFDASYLKEIRYVCLIMSEEYIRHHFSEILNYSCAIERRDDSDCTADKLIEDNVYNLKMCQRYNYSYILIQNDYASDLNINDLIH